MCLTWKDVNFHLVFIVSRPNFKRVLVIFKDKVLNLPVMVALMRQAKVLFDVFISIIIIL